MADHQNKHIREAIRFAEEFGWTTEKAGPLMCIWGTLYCRHSGRNGRRIRADVSTRETPEAHARDMFPGVDRCPDDAAAKRKHKMKEHDLILTADPTEDQADELCGIFNHGTDDRRRPTNQLPPRGHNSLEEAIRSAVKDVRTTGFDVERIEMLTAVARGDYESEPVPFSSLAPPRPASRRFRLNPC